MYVMAGLVSAPIWLPVGMVYEYDPGANTWTKKKPMALPAHHVALTEYNGKIYVFGGFTAGKVNNLAAWTPINNSFEYDPVKDTWKELAPMPIKRGAAGVRPRSMARSTSLAACRRIPDPASLPFIL